MAGSSVLEQIRKLDEQKKKLLEDAKKQALETAQKAVAELNELGFNYRLVEGGGQSTAPRATRSGTRRTGIRDEVLQAVKSAGPDGINRSQLLDQLGMRGNKSAEQSVSNALSALKKANSLDQKNGMYVAA